MDQVGPSMKASKEVRQWVNNRRSHNGKKNGVVPWLWDAPNMEVKDSNSKKLYSRLDKRLPRINEVKAND